jgi:protein-S-isoprenylcysteine O-methyltransferase Ste14
MLLKLMASILFIALMAIGWGSVDFFRDVSHLVVAGSILLAPIVFSGGSGRPMSSGKEKGESTLIFLVVAFLSILGVGFLMPFLAGHKIGLLPLRNEFQYLGILVYLFGYLIRGIATKKLKRQFSYLVTIQENHQLITSGIYSFIRHPVYLGSILILAGMFLIFPTTYGLLFVIFFTALLKRRMGVEERLLLKHFGSVYEEYSSKSYRLIPHIY